MRYIDRTGRTMGERGDSVNVTSLGALTNDACTKAELHRLAVLKTSWGAYKVIRESGLGYEKKSFRTLAEVDEYIKARIG